MTITTAPTVGELSDRLAEAFRTGDTGDLFTADVFLDGHPPWWRFQVLGVDDFGTWLRDYTRHRPRVSVLRTVATADGFVTEHLSSERTDDGETTSRKLLLCAVRDRRIASMTVYCSGDWGAQLRARHAAEAPMVRPDQLGHRPHTSEAGAPS